MATRTAVPEWAGCIRSFEPFGSFGTLKGGAYKAPPFLFLEGCSSRSGRSGRSGRSEFRAGERPDRLETFPNDSNVPNASNDQFSVNVTVTLMMTCTGTPFSSVGVKRH